MKSTLIFTIGCVFFINVQGTIIRFSNRSQLQLVAMCIHVIHFG